MRMIALAQHWKRAAGDVTFVTNCPDVKLIDALKFEGFKIIRLNVSDDIREDIETTRSIIKQLSGRWCVVDGYQFNEQYLNALSGSNSLLMVVDDNADRDMYDVDAILNQNLDSERLSYKTSSDATLLLGSNYVLLRDEFSRFVDSPKQIEPIATRVLITLGGTDPQNQTPKVVRALSEKLTNEFCVKIVLARDNPDIEQIKKHSHLSEARFEFVLGTSQMSELMNWADLAISAAGSTCWEMAALGLPAILLVTADNQQIVADGLRTAGVSECLGWYDNVTEEQIFSVFDRLARNSTVRSKMSSNGQRLIDGKGRERVVTALMARGPK